jgi:hypothetical protein
MPRLPDFLGRLHAPEARADEPPKCDIPGVDGLYQSARSREGPTRVLGRGSVSGETHLAFGPLGADLAQ